jgi:carbon monoxide dehydrogenase subunit G
MIETEQTVRVACDIDRTWAYAKDFAQWASIMPGYQSCEMEDADNSRWILKIGVGAMVRTVKVRVHVDEWAGPERVDFSYQLEGDPVVGSGSYLAVPADGGTTDMTLRVQVQGSGPMAPMWEAMGGPVLPKFAKSFAEQLRDRIEQANPGAAAAAAAAPAEPRRSVLGALVAWLRAVWRRFSGKNMGASA